MPRLRGPHVLEFWSCQSCSPASQTSIPGNDLLEVLQLAPYLYLDPSQHVNVAEELTHSHWPVTMPVFDTDHPPRLRGVGRHDMTLVCCDPLSLIMHAKADVLRRGVPLRNGKADRHGVDAPYGGGWPGRHVRPLPRPSIPPSMERKAHNDGAISAASP